VTTFAGRYAPRPAIFTGSVRVSIRYPVYCC
jgi:hypothetical protein